jgi:hypothetical protein
MISIIYAIHRVIRADGNTVGTAEYTITPRIQEFAIAIEYYNRMPTSVENINIVL